MNVLALILVEIPLRAFEQVSRIALLENGLPPENWREWIKIIPSPEDLVEKGIELTELQDHSLNGYARTSTPNGTSCTLESILISLAADVARKKETVEVVEEVKASLRQKKQQRNGKGKADRNQKPKHPGTVTSMKTSSTASTRTASPETVTLMKNSSTVNPTGRSTANSMPHSNSSTVSAGWIWTLLTLLTALTLSTFITTTRADDVKRYSIEKREYDPRAAPFINFTVYDCTQSLDNLYSGIDLGKIEECKDIHHDYMEPTNDTEITLVQANVPSLIDVYRCRLVIDKRLEMYGMHGHIWKVVDYIVGKKLYIDRDTCMALVQYRKFICPTEVCVGRPSHQVEVPPNVTKVIQWHTRGSWDKDSVQPESFVPEGSTETVWAVETATLKITLDHLVGEVDFSNDVLTVPSIGKRLDHDLTFAPLTEHGLIAWRKAKYRCNDTLSRIAVNNATIYKLKPEKQPPGADHELSGAMVIIKDEDEDRTSGVVIKSGYHHCLQQCHKTNVKDVLACVGKVAGIDDLTERPATSTTRINMQTMATVLYATNRLDRYELSQRMHASMCQLDRRTISQDFASILNARNPYALHGLELAKTGRAVNKTQAITLRGIVGYIHNCTSLEARLVQVSNCTQQIPCEITDRETGRPRLAFADPVNFHLLDYPEIVPCTPGLPMQYRIDDVYYCHNPEHMACPAGTKPTVIQPSVGSGAGGILQGDLNGMTGTTITANEEEIIRGIHRVNEHGDVVVSNVVRDVMANTMGVNGGEPEGIHFGMPLSKVDLEVLTGSVAGQMFFLFRIFGKIYLHCFGFMIVLSIIQYIFNSLYRLYFVWKHNDKRIGLYLFKALFAVLFSSAILPLLIFGAVGKAVKERMDQDREKIVPDVDYAIYQERVKFTERQIESMREFMISNFKGDRDSEEFKALKRTLYPSKELSLMKKRQEQEDGGVFKVVTDLLEGRDHGSPVRDDAPSAPTESAATGDQETNVLRLMNLAQEAGARDVCQEFMEQSSFPDRDDVDEEFDRGKQLALTELIKRQKTELRKLEDLLDKRIEEEESTAGESQKDTKRDISEYQGKILQIKAFIGQLEGNLIKLVNKEQIR